MCVLQLSKCELSWGHNETGFTRVNFFSWLQIRTLLRHLSMVWSKRRFQSLWWRAAVWCVCTCAPMLPFLGWLKGVHFFIVFVVCYYIKVCFKANGTVYAALWTRLHAWPVWVYVHKYMSIPDWVPLLNLWKKVRQMVVSQPTEPTCFQLKTSESVSKLQMHTRAQRHMLTWLTPTLS